MTRNERAESLVSAEVVAWGTSAESRHAKVLRLLTHEFAAEYEQKMIK